MKFDKLYNDALKMWPEKIDISDGKIQEEGILFKKLSDIWNNIEIRTKEQSEWHDLITWVIFSNFHRIAKNRFLKQDYSIKKTDLSFDHIKADFIQNLKEPGYEDMLEIFYNDNPTA